MSTMKITILGTGGSTLTLARDTVSILVDDKILIDCADGTTKKLMKLIDLGSLEAILLSHVHGDHFAGLLALIWRLWLGEDRSQPLDIYGPIGIKEIIKTLFKITRTPVEGFRFKINYHEINGDKIEQVGSYSALKVAHSAHTLAFRVDRDKSMCYSGDTGPFTPLAELAKNCDVLIHESSGPASHTSQLHGFNHSTSEDAALIASQAGARMLIPIHFLPFVKDPEEEMRPEMEKIYGGKIIFPKDMQVIEI